MKIIKLIVYLFFLLFIYLFLLEDIVYAAQEGEGASENSPFINYDNHDVRIDSKVTAEMLDKKLRGKLANTGSLFLDAGKANGLDPAFLASISMHETGGDSKLLNDYNNVGGITCRDQTTKKDCVYFKDRYWQTFPSIAEGIKFKAELIKRAYVDEGLHTISQIQKKYCPDGDGDCATSWVSGVSGMMKSFLVPSNNSSGEVSDGTGEYSDGKSAGNLYENYFSPGEISLGNVGIDDREGNSDKVNEYLGNRYITGVGLFLFKIAQVASIFLIGYIVILWLLAIMSVSGLYVANEWLNKGTFNKIDVMSEGLGKLGIWTGFSFVVLVLIMTGLIPKFFAFVYYLLGQFIDFLSQVSIW